MPSHPPIRSAAFALCAALGCAQAGDELPLISVVVAASRDSQLGVASASSAGSVTRGQLAARTAYRPAELLEATPGLVVSPKLGLVFGPWAGTEVYLNAGTGSHSDDARGVELGLRSEAVRGRQSTLSVYRLDSDSELMFVGDAGTTEAGRPSRRTGFELSTFYKPNRWLTVDADLAYARARFRDGGEGRRIAGAVERVASLALAVDKVGPWYGALQLRYFGARPLVEGNTVRSRATATLNGRIGYRVSDNVQVELEGFNLGNRRDAAIEYFSASRLPGEPVGGKQEVHFHPTEPRSFRLALNAAF